MQNRGLGDCHADKHNRYQQLSQINVQSVKVILLKLTEQSPTFWHGVQ